MADDKHAMDNPELPGTELPAIYVDQFFVAQNLGNFVGRLTFGEDLNGKFHPRVNIVCSPAMLENLARVIREVQERDQEKYAPKKQETSE